MNLFCVEKKLSSFDGDISTAENVTRKLCSSRMLFYTPGKELTCNGQQSLQLQWILFTVFKQPFSWDFPIRRQHQTQYNRCLIHCYFQERNFSKIVYSEPNWTQVHVLSSLHVQASNCPFCEKKAHCRVKRPSNSSVFLGDGQFLAWN